MRSRRGRGQTGGRPSVHDKKQSGKRGANEQGALTLLWRSEMLLGEEEVKHVSSLTMEGEGNRLRGSISRAVRTAEAPLSYLSPCCPASQLRKESRFFMASSSSSLALDTTVRQASPRLATHLTIPRVSLVSALGCTFTRRGVCALLLLTLSVLRMSTVSGVPRKPAAAFCPSATKLLSAPRMQTAFLRTSPSSSRASHRGRRVAFLSSLPTVSLAKTPSGLRRHGTSQAAFSPFSVHAASFSRSASPSFSPFVLSAASRDSRFSLGPPVPPVSLGVPSPPRSAVLEPGSASVASSQLSSLWLLGRKGEETFFHSRKGPACKETALSAQTPGHLGADEEGPLPTVTLTQEDLDFYRELGVSPQAPWWEVQQAYEMKHSEVEDERTLKKMETAFLQISGKRFNKDFLEICRRYERQHQPPPSGLSKLFSWIFGRKQPPVHDVDWDSGFPSEEDPAYMSQVDAPREIKEIMMGLGDRSGVFRDISREDDKRQDGLLRRFDLARVSSTGGFFVPLALVSLSSSKLITPALTTAFGLAASYMGKIDSTANPQSAGGQRGFSPPTLKTLLWTGGLLLLHAVLGVAGASALLTAIGRLPLGLRPESVVAAMVILQWWLSAVAYRTHEPVGGDNFDDAEDDFDADDSHPKVQDGSDDDDAGDDDLSGPLDD
ncbi:hypothetical protein TGP89_248770 [Toxoplasma gondii p89]|uniref:Uncharacterized protein n=1 Tax=Toxoplasma gondii p89 TaxID=943119 RepID=A0A086KVP9_TOXGO|nr:hypothetical protein TGP89_248770 [Toxoplasma gondii p89]